MHYTASLKTRKQQRGAALIIGLLLLLVLTILGISGMNSASMEFIMAGNEQFKSNSFQAAEAGIQSVILDRNQFPVSSASTAIVSTVANQAIPGSTDTFDRTTTFIGKTPSVSGNSQGQRSGSIQLAAYQFSVNATGKSARNSLSNTAQGIAVTGPDDPSIAPLSGTNSWR